MGAVFGKCSLKCVARAIMLGWTVFLFAWAVWQIMDENRQVLESAHIQAADSFEKDLVYRRWIAGHGGVYVPVTEKTPPNPYLSHMTNRDVTTTSGLKLTMMNPAYMTRQVHELGYAQYGHRGHITSLNPIRPENMPDQWEAKALRAFEGGETEVSEKAKIGDLEYLRMMRPMVTEASCLKCHAAQGYQVGDMRGGISVAVPLAPLQKSMRRQMKSMIIGFVFVWILGIGGIYAAGSQIKLRLRQQAEAAAMARDREERYRVLFEGSRDAIMTLEPPSWSFTSGNPACIEMFGAKDEADFTSYPPWKLSPERQPDGRLSGDKAKEMIECAMRDGSNFFEWTHTRITGEEFPATVLLARLEVKGEAFLQATVRDISAQKNMEKEKRVLDEQMRQKQKMAAVGTLARGAAHEINNPLNGIMNYAQLIKDQSVSGSEPAEFSNEIIEESKRIASIVRGIMSFSKGHDEVRISAGVRDLLEPTLHLMGGALAVDKITLEQVIPDGLPAVFCQVSLMREVLASLISNAQDALNERYPKGNKDKILIITAEQAEQGGKRFLRIILEDHGNGIPPEIRERVFDAFFTTKERASINGFIGRGLGLTAALHIARENGGDLKEESEPGKYARFILDLPVADIA